MRSCAATMHSSTMNEQTAFNRPIQDAWQFLGQCCHQLLVLLCLLNGISRIRFQIPSSDPSVSGRLLMVSSILPTGLKFTHSPYRGLALIILPPVKNLISASAKRQNQRRFYLLTSGIKPRGAKRSVNKRTSPMVIRRVCAAFSIRCNRSQWAGSMPEVSKVISQRPIGSASIQKNQTTKPPRTAPQLFPEPPTITITQIRKVKRSG